MIRKATVWGYHAPAPRNRVSVYPLSTTAGQKPATAHRNAVLDPKALPGRIRRMKNRDVSHAPTTLRGFTLVELMVTVAVVAILMAIGAPQLRSFLQKQQVAADMETLKTSLQLTRSEALKHNGRVSMCALATAPTTPTAATCAASSKTGSIDWSLGWLVFVDYGTAGFDNTVDSIVKIEQPTHSQTITGTANIVSFQSNGLSVGAAGGSFTVSPGTTADALCRKLTFNAQGRITLSTFGDCS
jgi:type IV fimbrial biogenesis protein FimT